MKSKIAFVADFFKDDLLGGAESNDSVLIKYLEKQGHEVKKIPSAAASSIFFENFSGVVIVSNFVSLGQDVQQAIQDTCDYIIYEHDHKYLTTRNPSVFPGFKAPPEHIINRDFYQKAHAVVVLSNVCKEVMELNLQIDNVVSIGTSLWSEQKFDFITGLATDGIEKDFTYSVLNSKNPTKGSKEAYKWCQSNGIEPTLIAGEEHTFLHQLARTEKLVFMPQVLETFCRVAVEAKMLGCKLVTKPALLGFASEDCFELSGVPLIKEMRRRTKKALKLFEEMVSEKKGDGEITAILTCYKRPHLLVEQIKVLQNQTVPPKDIWVWINEPEEHSFDYSEIKRSIDVLGVKIFDSNHNWKFFGRFAAAMLADTEYIAIYDDDTMPGKKWHQNCLETMGERPGILGGIGVVLPGERYYGHRRVGWSAPNAEIEQVDLVGHAWFFKSEWMQYFWREKPYTWENGEDIHFSYTAQKYGGIKTYVPPHPVGDKDMFSSLKGMEYGVDDVATSATRNHEVFYKQRNACVKHAVDNGWKLVK